MKTIFADYNARTEAGDICLTTQGSREGVERIGVQRGDWAWLSDGEVVVGAQLAVDQRYGLVGVPDWDTVVHLDDEDANDPEQIRRSLLPLLNKVTFSESDEPRVYELLTQWELVSPEETLDASRGYFPFRRALALREMEKPELALLEMTEARAIAPDDPERLFVYLDLLRVVDLPRPSLKPSDGSSPDLPAVLSLYQSSEASRPGTDAEFECSQDVFDGVVARRLPTALWHISIEDWYCFDGARSQRPVGVS